MVYYFVSNVTDPPATIYVGKDKFESTGPHPTNPPSTVDYARKAKADLVVRCDDL